MEVLQVPGGEPQPATGMRCRGAFGGTPGQGVRGGVFGAGGTGEIAGRDPAGGLGALKRLAAHLNPLCGGSDGQDRGL